MLLSVGIEGWQWLRPHRPVTSMVSERLSPAIPLICALGIGVAVYLAFVETTVSPVACGPVVDCNTVSEYARLFGAWGIASYAAILLTWIVGRYPPLRRGATIIQFGLALLGVLVSIYLTFLEPFVIGITCAGCLTSAIVITLLLWLTAPPARAALRRGP